jgi:hypothetical protein
MRLQLPSTDRSVVAQEPAPILPPLWKRRRFTERLTGCRLRTRAEFVAGVAAAVHSRSGFAAAKVGPSERFLLFDPLLAADPAAAGRRAGYQRHLLFQCSRNLGLFPADCRFYLEYAQAYGAQLQQLDSVGIFADLSVLELEIVRHYGCRHLYFYQDQEPDRSTPSRSDLCYLPQLAGRRLLIICPFADLLRRRATREIFEGVWSRTGKPWFFPASVEAIEFPYGFSAEARARYRTTFDLLDGIMDRVAAQRFDVALIGAAGLAIPLAARIKALGKVAISLGGHLQVLFGVLGKRWRADQEWQDRYINEHWIDMPARYRPAEDDVCDRGAYW